MNTRTKFGRPVAAAIGTLMLAGAAPAFAADVTYNEPPSPAPVFEQAPIASWAGGYVGLQGGYSFSGRVKAPGNTINTDGFTGGAFGGWNGQSGMVVYGVEADIGYNGSKGSNAGLHAKNGVDGSLRARIGAAVTDNVLVYGTAGGAASRLKVSDATGHDTNTMLGWTAGVGTDIKLTEQVFARGEYRYTDYGNKTFDLPSGSGRINSRENKLLLGLGVKF
jgi:outer membrane immunogenic protein